MTLYFGFPLMNPFRSQVPAGFYHPIKGHTGIDVDMPSGTPLSMPIPLKCVNYEYLGEMGNTLYLEDAKGNILIFAHLDHAEVAIGEEIPEGKIFAVSDNTGTATTAPHLHFEIISAVPDEGFDFMTRSLGGFSGYNIDPTLYLKAMMESEEKLNAWFAEAMTWAREQGLITIDHDAGEPVKWGELVVFSKRLAERVDPSSKS